MGVIRGITNLFAMSNSTSRPSCAPTGEDKIRNVLVVCTVPTSKSGIPSVIFNLLSAIDRSGLRLHYVSINEPGPDFTSRLARLGIGYSVVPREMRHPLRYVNQLARLGRGFDAVHVHGNSATMVLEMLAARKAGIPLRIAHAHSTSCNMKSIDRCMRPLFHRLCNSRIACSEASGEWLFGHRPFTLLKNAVDSRRFAFNAERRGEMRRALGVEHCKVIGHVGNFLPVKNHDFLLDVFSHISRTDSGTRLLLVGDGELAAPIRSKIARLGLEGKVILTGSVDNPEDYLQAMDMAILPSLYEGFPLSIVEQQVNGLPVLASDAVTPKVDLSGLVSFAPLDAGAEVWATKALDILSTTPHTPQSASRGLAGVSREGFDIVAVAARLRQIYLHG